jgi:hypothetical protein
MFCSICLCFQAGFEGYCFSTPATLHSEKESLVPTMGGCVGTSVGVDTAKKRKMCAGNETAAARCVVVILIYLSRLSLGVNGEYTSSVCILISWAKVPLQSL